MRYLTGKATDPLGLSSWSVGDFEIGGGKGGLGANVARFQATSECVDGKQAFSQGYITSVGAGFGAVLFSARVMELEDGLDYLNPRALEGRYISYSAGAYIGGGTEYSSVIMGQAHASFQWGGAGGIGAGVSADFGAVKITSLNVSGCLCK